MAKRKKRESVKGRSGLTFNHAMVYVRKVTRALEFYKGLLGFRLIEQYRGGNFPGYARLQSPRVRTTLALHELERGHTLAKTSSIRLYFEVKDLDRLCKKLAAGAEISQMPQVMPWGWKHAYLKDPDGHELSLYWAGVKRFRKTVG